jgi:hypothetical protein
MKREGAFSYFLPILEFYENSGRFSHRCAHRVSFPTDRTMLTVQSLSPRAIAHNGLFVPTRETAICPAVDLMRTFCRWVPALALDLYLNQLIATPSEYSFHLSQLLARPAASIWLQILRKKSSHTKNRAR